MSKELESAFTGKPITNNQNNHSQCRGIHVGETDHYDLFMNGKWILYKNLQAGIPYPYKATGARHASDASAPDLGDIVFLY